MHKRTPSMLRRATVAVMTALAVLSCAAYVRALWKADQITLLLTVDGHHAHSFAVRSERGRLSWIFSRFELKPGFAYLDPKKQPNGRVRVYREAWVRETDMAPWEFPTWRVDLGSTTAAGVTDTYTASVSAILFGGANSLLPIYAWRRARRARARAKIGKCPRCGYDLRATPGFCPECGPARDTLAMRWKTWARSRRKASPASTYTPLAGATRFLTTRTQTRRDDKVEQPKK